MENKKNDKANIDKQRMTILLLGLGLSMALIVAAFEYYSLSSGPASLKGKMADTLDEEEIEQIVLSTPPPPPPPPPPAAIENVEVVEDEDVQETELNLDQEAENTEDVFVEEEEKGPEVEEIFEFVAQSAEYPGGTTELYKWLNNEVKYPAIAKDNGIQGKVYVRFVVEKDGSIGEAFVQNVGKTHPSLEKEALRVVKSMKKWIPAQNNGKVVRSWFNLPVNFKLK
ncbi:MAG: energy transducer TonB [Bacteroidia bacterium]